MILNIAMKYLKIIKQCKEFGRELAYKESLAQKPILKAYRSRYQTLSKQASEREKHEMYEYFKKERSYN